LQAVTTVKGKQVCYVQNGDGVAAVPVMVGNFNDQFIEIRSGLKEGDQVALTPPASASEDIDLGGSVLSAENSRPTPTTTTAKKNSTEPPRL
jgi:septal ring-binding cell division protein DamX